MKKILIPLATLVLCSSGMFAQYGSKRSVHNTSFLTSAKKTTAVNGYITAGVFPVAPTAANTVAPTNDFVIEHFDATTGNITFSNYYNLQTSGTNCGNNTVWPPWGPFGWYKGCIAVDVIETNVVAPNLDYAFMAIYRQGIVFGTIDNTGTLVDSHFWNVPGGAVASNPTIRESSTPGIYYMSCVIGNRAYVMKYQRMMGTATWAKLYQGMWIEPYDLIESPYNSNELVVVGKAQMGGSPLALEGFFLKLNAGNGAVMTFNLYSDSWGGDEWFNKIEPANSFSGGSNGYIIGGRMHSFDPSTAGFRTSWMLKVDPNGNTVWSSIFNGGDIVDVFERPNPNQGTFEYFGLSRGSSAPNNNELHLYKLDDFGAPYTPTPNRYEYPMGTIGISYDQTYPQLVSHGDGFISNPLDGAVIFGTDISSGTATEHVMHKAYYNGVDGCENSGDFNQMSGPGISATPFLPSASVQWDCIYFLLNEVNTLQSSSNYCATGWAATQFGGSNWRPAATTGLNEQISGMNLNLNPNPSSGTFNLDLDPQAEPLNVEIRNSIGQLSAKFEFPSNETQDGRVTIDLSTYDLSSGIYFVNVSSGKRSYTQKLIYNK